MAVVVMLPLLMAVSVARCLVRSCAAGTEEKDNDEDDDDDDAQ